MAQQLDVDKVRGGFVQWYALDAKQSWGVLTQLVEAKEKGHRGPQGTWKKINQS